MESSLIIGGFGGQGVMLMGQLLGYSACKAGKNVTFLPSYGPEQRGGTANCTVVISEKTIGSPIAPKIDVLIAMNEPSLKKFQHLVKPKGTIIVNSSMTLEKTGRNDVNSYYIPADDIAYNIGSKKVGNIVMLGAYIYTTDVLSIEELESTIVKKLAKKAEMIEMNKKALRRGMEEAGKQ